MAKHCSMQHREQGKGSGKQQQPDLSKVLLKGSIKQKKEARNRVVHIAQTPLKVCKAKAYREEAQYLVGYN